MVNGFDTDVPYTVFMLNTYYNKNDILQKFRYNGGGTKTGQNLQFMLENHFVASAGSQKEEGNPQIAVVITNW